MFNNINKFIKEIKKIKVESLKEKLLTNIYRYLDKENTKIKVNRNELFIKCSDGSELIIVLEKDGISYQSKQHEKVENGKYSKYKDGYYVKITNTSKSTYSLDDKYSHNITIEEEFRIFDKNGYEQFRRMTTKLDNYYEDKTTGKITLHEPNIMENYIENKYLYRTDEKYILERNIKKYKYPDGTKAFIDIKHSDDCYLRNEIINKDTKELPNWGHFYGIDREVFFNYFQEKATIDDVIDNFHSKKYHIPHDICI